MITTFKRVPLTESETDLSLLTFVRRIGLTSRKWKLFLFFIPVFVLLGVLSEYIDLAVFLREFSKIAALFMLVITVNFLLRIIEVRLKFKKVGQVQVLARVDFFFFKVLLLRPFLPLILEPQNHEFDRLNKGDFIILEKTALNRLMGWRII